MAPSNVVGAEAGVALREPVAVPEVERPLEGRRSYAERPR